MFGRLGFEIVHELHLRAFFRGCSGLNSFGDVLFSRFKSERNGSGEGVDTFSRSIDSKGSMTSFIGPALAAGKK